MKGPLEGIRVVDISRVLGGPYCGQVLADYGADVLKVEPPQGDETRMWGPPFKDGLSAYFAGANRNKRTITINLRMEEGRDLLFHLMEEADVLIHNFKPGAMEKWGMGFEDVLHKRFPKLIQCHVTGFGAEGPLGGFPGYDAVVQAMTGLMSINGDPKGKPTRMGIPIVDLGTGLIACIGILSALVERQSSGLGQAVEVPLYDCALSLLHPQGANALMSGNTPVATGNGHPNIVPYDSYPTNTKQIFLGIGNNGQFRKLCEIIGLDHIPDDKRFLDNAARMGHREALTEILSERLKSFDAEALEQDLLNAGVPAGAVRTVTEALEHPHTEFRNMVVSVDNYSGIGIPAKFSRTPGAVRTAPPIFGEHTEEVLTEYGYRDEEIQNFLEKGVVTN